MCRAWEAALQVIEQLKQHHFQAWIVGGAVRDRLLQREVADVDIVTTASAEEVERLFPKTFRMSNEHETVIVREQNEHLEVTTIRGQTIEEDLKRRDLTINSIAEDDEQILDPTGGEDDLKARLLRSYMAHERMSEDPLRMLRVYRFVSELGFDIDSQLEKAIKEQGPLLRHVAVERIVKEWLKVLKGKERNLALDGLFRSALYKLVPRLTLEEDTIYRLKKLPSLHTESEVVCWFMFCLCLDIGDESPLRQLALSNEQLRAIRTRLHFFKQREKMLWNASSIYKAKMDVVWDVEKGRRFLNLVTQPDQELQNIWEGLPIHHRSDLAISGNDLVEIKPAGPWIKEELEWIEDEVVNRKIENKKENLLGALERRRKNAEGRAPKNI